jgi:hypothetical protein
MRALSAVVVLAVGSAALAETPLDRARAAVAAAPDRPGLRLVLADLLFEAGDLAAAEAEARRVLADWPASHRARLLLARIDAARGDDERAEATLADVAATAPAPIAADALRLLDAPVPSPWRFGARVGADYDSAADVTCDADLVCRDEAARRFLLGVDLGFERPRWALRAGGSVVAADAVERDRAVYRVAEGWAEARTEHPAGPARLGGRLEGRAFAYLGGEDESEAGLGGGATAWIRGADPAFAPFFQVRGLYLDPQRSGPLGDGPGGWQTEAATGFRVLGGRFDTGLRLAADWWADTFREYGADLDGGVDLAPVRLFARVGAGWRDYDEEAFASELRPRAGGGAALALGEGFSVVAEAFWLAAHADGEDALRDRLITGVHLDMRR